MKLLARSALAKSKAASLFGRVAQRVQVKPPPFEWPIANTCLGSAQKRRTTLRERPSSPKTAEGIGFDLAKQLLERSGLRKVRVTDPFKRAVHPI